MVWGTAGDSFSLKWDHASNVGSMHNLVMGIGFKDDTVLLGKLIACGTMIRMHLPSPDCLPASAVSVTILGAQLIDKLGVPTFRIDDPCSVLAHFQWTRDDVKHVIDACSGIGCGTSSLSEVGMKVVAAVDTNPKFLALYEQLHPGTPTVQGSVGHAASVARVHTIHPRPAVLAAGFSCQPFSTGGSMQGANDDRSKSLHEVLVAGYLLQCPALVLECVSNAGTNRMVRASLDTFCKECHFACAETDLKLEDVWVSRRERWWAVLTPLILGKCPLRSFLDLSFPKVVKHVLPSPLFFPEDQLRQLVLSPEEREAFVKRCPRVSSMLLGLSTSAPTALHSWGSQATGCHCECRLHGFSDATLASRGLYGILIPLDVHECPVEYDLESFPAVRHPHPTEVAILNGVLPPQQWPADLRLCLAGLGQMASPMQMLWICAQLQAFYDRFHRGTTALCPNALLDGFRFQVVQAAKEVTTITPCSVAVEACQCPVPAVVASPSVGVTPWYGLSHQGAVSACSVWSEGSLQLVTLASLSLTVADLIHAHTDLLGLSHVLCLDCSDGSEASPDTMLNGRCFAFVGSSVQVQDVVEHPLEEPSTVEISPTVPWHALETELAEPVGPATCAEPSEPSAKRLRVDEFDTATPVDTPQDPLLTLTEAELLQLQAPSMPDVHSFLALRKTQMPARERSTLLQMQTLSWGDDELTWHMHQLASQAAPGTWTVLDPLIATQAVLSGHMGIVHLWFRDLGFKPKHIMSAVNLEGHWTPFVWVVHSKVMLVQSWDSAYPDRRCSKLHEALSNAAGSSTFQWKNVSHRFDSSGLCGLCALRFLHFAMFETKLPESREEALALHSDARSEFSTFVHFCFKVPRPWIWGQGLDSKAHERLRNLLTEHGVPANAVEARIHLVTQAFDRAALQTALTSAQPWRNLKAQANQLKPAFQLVLAHELDDVVRTKATKGVGKGKRRKNNAREQPAPKLVPPPELDPQKLMLEDGSFVSASGHALKQVGLSKVGPFCEGVVLSTHHEVAAYLKAGHVVSSGALAFVLLNTEHTLLDTRLSWSSIRTVARCQANGEPMLLPALLVQLGKVAVSLKQSTSACVIPSVQAACIKVSVYKDMVQVPWDEITSSPVRFVLKVLAPLTRCTCDPTMQCDGPCWHPTEADAVQDPVLDVWRKQWVSASFRPVQPAVADVFMLNIRYLGALEEKILSYSGVGGVFVEPRSLCARHPVLDYQVLWLGKSDLAELQRLRSCHPSILGLARMGNRLGVRVATSEAADAAKVLKPGSIFLASGSRSNYEVGPLPYGTDRMALAKVISQHGWQARPLHVSRSVDELGVMWIVQACSGPPAAVLPYQGGELVVTKMAEKTADSTGDKTAIIGASATLQLCAMKTAPTAPAAVAPKTDPWGLWDPWKSSGHGSPPEPASLATIAEQVEKKVRAKLPKDMEVDSDHAAEVNARFAAIEQQVQSLTVNQQNLTSQIGAVQTRVTQSMDHQSQEIQAMFQKQMTQIEQLLGQRSWRPGRSQLALADGLWECDHQFCAQPLPCHSVDFASSVGLLPLVCFLCLLALGFATARCLLSGFCDVLLTSGFDALCTCPSTSCHVSAHSLDFGLSLSWLCFALVLLCLWIFIVSVGSTQCRWTFPRISLAVWNRAVLWLTLLLCVRFGEAGHPGPDWTLGLLNVNGASAKLGLFQDKTVDTWLLCETHLTAVGKRSFMASLRGLGSPYCNLAHGSPVLPRSQASDVGQWTGVGALSCCPQRPLPHAWTETTFRSGRLVCVATLHSHVWVTGVVMYGPPGGPTHPRARETVDFLISQSLERLTEGTGPRYLAGDFNHDLDRLQMSRQLARLGWKEAQDLHAERTGHLPEATCRQKTRRDFLFMSPELSALFLKCEVHESGWSDHSTIVTTFQGGSEVLSRFAWPMPGPMEWQATRTALPMPQFKCPAQVDLDYTQFWAQVEESNFCALAQKGQAVVRACGGRGRTVKPQRRVLQLAPVKTGRVGDRVPTFFGSNLQYVQWVKQSRRLLSFVRLVNAVDSPQHALHKHQLWTSILLASGFNPTFAAWWAHRSHAHGEPPQIPGSPPSVALAKLIQLGMESELHQLERALKMARNCDRKMRYISDPAALYREVKRNPPTQVDTLLHSSKAKVIDIHPDDCSVSLDPPCLWFGDKPFVFPHATVSAIHIEPDRLWLDDVSQISLGASVRQDVCVGSLPALFSAFEEQWSTLWSRHQNVPSSQWNDILRFAQEHLRPVQAQMPPITPTQIREAIRSKKPRAATGLDGVARADALALLPEELDSVLSLFNQAETTGVWPSALLHGGVRSLAKTDHPTLVSHFRPICVFGFLYRIWSSLHSRFWLSALSDTVDAWLCGNRKRCQASTIWSHLMEQVETARHSDVAISGITLDLVKAFNTLPRVPTLAFAKMLGVGHSTLVGWAGALAGFHRHFIIRGSYSPGVKSHCGFPEGCGLSCVGMAVVTEVFHAWVRASSMHFRALTYVDDWTILVRDEALAAKALQTAESFARALDLQIDRAKTFAWSSHPGSRRALRDQGLKVVASCRELGAHVAFTKQITNKTLGDRLDLLSDFWAKLRAMPCAFLQKLQLIHRVAWPRALHAVSAVVVGKKKFASLRTCYMKAVRLDKPGANPHVQCFLDGIVMDPQMYAIVDTVRAFRIHGQSADGLLNLSLTCAADGQEVWTHATSVLRQRIDQCGFQLQADGLVNDRFGFFDLSSCNFPEVLWRLQCGWTFKVAAMVSHRPSFREFFRVDAPATRAGVRKLPNFDQGVVRRHLNGATFANEHAHHWNADGQSLCALCGEPDSLRHRLWECTHSAPLRDNLPSMVLDCLPDLPEVACLHGWTLTSSWRDPWIQYLCSVPCEPSFVWPETLPVILDLFTDGTCWCPTLAHARVAAWSVVLHSPCDASSSFWHVHPVAAQPLAGVVQTIFRAELSAVLAAAEFVVQTRRHARIWCDCQAVILGFQKFVVRRFPVNPNAANADLWTALQILVWDYGTEFLQVVKVPSHQDLSEEISTFDRWLVIGNEAADSVAKTANQQRGQETWALWFRYVLDTEHCQTLASLIREHQVKVAALWAPSSAEPAEAPVPVMKPPRPARKFKDDWVCPDPLPEPKAPFRRLFGTQLQDRVSEWFHRIHAPTSEVRWISFYQLYVHFQSFVEVLVVKLDGKWSVDFSPGCRLRNHFKIALRVKGFRLMLQQWFRDHSIIFHTAVLRPFSNWIACHRGCVAIPIHDHVCCDTEQILSSVMDRPATGQGKSLDHLRFSLAKEAPLRSLSGDLGTREKKNRLFVYGIGCSVNPTILVFSLVRDCLWVLRRLIFVCFSSKIWGLGRPPTVRAGRRDVSQRGVSFIVGQMPWKHTYIY